MCVTNRGRRRFTSLPLSARHLAKSGNAGGTTFGKQTSNPTSLLLSGSRYVQSNSAETLPTNGGLEIGPNATAGCASYDHKLHQAVECISSSTVPPAASPAAAVSKKQQQIPTEGTYVDGVYVPPPKPQPKRIRKPQKPGKTAKMNERHFVKHDYHDHAEDEDEQEHSADEIAAAVLGQSKDGKKKHKAVSVSFPRKLHFLLDQIEADGLAHVISWLPHGRAFAVHKPKDFVENVMPKYFKQTKLTSFQRQLNLYGFARLTRGRDSGGYYNEYFLRGKPSLTKNMVRTRVKGTKFKASSSPDQEPNFYNMKPVNLPKALNPHVIVSEDEKTSFSASGTSLADSERENSEHYAKPSFPAPTSPPHVVVTVASFDTNMPEVTWLAPNAPVSPICCTNKSDGSAIPTDDILEHMATIPEQSSPMLVQNPSVRGSNHGRNLWDCLDPFTPTPVPPNLDQPIPEEAPWQPPKATSLVGAAGSPSRPAIVSAPPSRSESGTLPNESHEETEIFDKDTLNEFLSVLRSTSLEPSKPEPVTEEVEEDPLLDLVHDWVSADTLEQAATNDADFGRMLEMIAE